MLTSYLPHPFLVASALLFWVTWRAFVSVRRRAKHAHPKSRRPLRLAIESVLLGLFVLTVCVAVPLLFGDPSRIDLEYILVMVIMALGFGVAYFMAPFMGYNLLWNTMMFQQDRAPFLALMLAMLFLAMGIQAQIAL